MNLEKIGKFLAELRKEQGLTQEQLGQQIGVTNKTVSRWEKGNYLPPAEMLKALSDFYGLSINELLSGERLSESAYMEKAEENISAIMKESGFTRREGMLVSIQWLRRNWWRILLCLLPAGCLYAITPYVVSQKLGAVAMATSLLVSGAAIVVHHMLFHVSAAASKAGKDEAFYGASKIRAAWTVILGVMIFICIDLLLATIHALTPAGSSDGYAIYSLFYDVLIQDGGIYPDRCFDALERGMWQLFQVIVINLDLAVLWMKKR